MNRVMAKKVVAVLDEMEAATTYVKECTEKLRACGAAPHAKWVDVMKAFADGATIEFRTSSSGDWGPIKEPSFLSYCEYRVKPEPALSVWMTVYCDADGNKDFGGSYTTEAEAIKRQSEWRNPIGCFEFRQVLPE